MASDDIVTAVRLQVMQTARDRSRVPDAREVAQALGLSKGAVIDAYRQLHDRHVFVLEPGATERLRMASPFSAVPTPFRVQVGERSWWGNCLWDGLGIIAALGGNGVMTTTCADCGQPEAVGIADAQLQHGSGIAYIGVPALLVGQHHPYLKHDATLPVGRPPRPVARAEGTGGRWNDAARHDVAACSHLVSRPI